MKRRALLAATVGGMTFLAGCAAAQPPGTDDDDTSRNDGDDDNGTDDDNDGNGGDGDGDGDGDGSIETTGTDCGGPDDDRALAVGTNGAVRLLGTTPSPNPCHAATLESSAVEDGQLTVTIGVKSTLGDDEDCIQCHGAIEYDARIDVDPAAIDDVVVIHDEGETHELPLQEPEAVPAIEDVAVKTTDARCRSGDDEETAAAKRHGEVYVVTGVRTVPDPCHEAIVEEVSIDDDGIDLVVDFEPAIGDDESCAQCLGTIEYEVAIELVGARLLEEIRVEHRGEGSHVIPLT